MPSIEIGGITLGLNLDWSWIFNLGDQPLYVIMWHFFVNGGWLMFVAAFIYGGWINWVYLRQMAFARKQAYVFLAIDIPKTNLQTPKAVENIFITLAGAHMPGEFWEKKIMGEFQLGFSLEVVSIGGMVQFLIRTPVQWRNLVEAAIYSQYPEAEIAEVEDYTAPYAGVHFPSDEYNLWGCDLVLVKDDYFPIKTYLDFQEKLDNEFKDPMAAILEVMNKIGPGEQIWLQLQIFPADNDWHKKGDKAVAKMVGLPETVKKNWLDKTVDFPLWLLTAVSNEIFRGLFPVFEEKKKEVEFNMMRLPPGKKEEIEAIQRKLGKIAFNSKFRLVYFGKKEVFKKGLGVSGMIGAIKQFTSDNGFKPGPNKTQARIWLKDFRTHLKQNNIFLAYRSRNATAATKNYTLCVEELATLFHFPYIEVKAPLVRKIEAKKSMAPIGLPVEEGRRVAEEKTPAAPQELVPVVDYDNDYFEKRFAVDKTGQADKERKKTVMAQLAREKKVAAVEPREDLPAVAPSATKSDVPDNIPFVD